MDYGKLLDGIENAGERTITKKLLSQAVVPFLEELEERYAALEKRIYEEALAWEQEACIWNGLYEPEQEALPQGLFPILPDSSSQITQEALSTGGEKTESGTTVWKDGILLQGVCLLCSFPVLKQLLGGSVLWEGKLLVGEEAFPAQFQIVRDTRYEKELFRLHEIFLANGSRLGTPNIPYVYRMGRILLKEAVLPKKLPKGEVRAQPELGEYKEVIKEGLVPVWNVEWEKEKTHGFPYPCEDEVFYEHCMKLPEDGIEDAFFLLPEEGSFRGIRRQGNRMFVSTREEDSRVFWMARIHMGGKLAHTFLSRELFCSQVQDSYIRRLILRTGIRPDTKAELERLLSSMDAAKGFLLVKMEFTSGKEKETYEMNAFREESPHGFEKREECLLLSFRYSGPADGFVTDRLSFLISALQENYPAYAFAGTIIL